MLEVPMILPSDGKNVGQDVCLRARHEGVERKEEGKKDDSSAGFLIGPRSGLRLVIRSLFVFAPFVWDPWKTTDDSSVLRVPVPVPEDNAASA